MGVSYKTQAIVIGPKAVAGAPRPPRGSFLSKSVWRVRGPRNPDLAKAISLGGGVDLRDEPWRALIAMAAPWQVPSSDSSISRPGWHRNAEGRLACGRCSRGPPKGYAASPQGSLLRPRLCRPSRQAALGSQILRNYPSTEESMFPPRAESLIVSIPSHYSTAGDRKASERPRQTEERGIRGRSSG